MNEEEAPQGRKGSKSRMNYSSDHHSGQPEINPMGGNFERPPNTHTSDLSEAGMRELGEGAGIVIPPRQGMFTLRHQVNVGTVAKPEVRPLTKIPMWPLEVELAGQKWCGDLGVMARA